MVNLFSRFSPPFYLLTYLMDLLTPFILQFIYYIIIIGLSIDNILVLFLLLSTRFYVELFTYISLLLLTFQRDLES